MQRNEGKKQREIKRVATKWSCGRLRLPNLSQEMDYVSLVKKFQAAYVFTPDAMYFIERKTHFKCEKIKIHPMELERLIEQLNFPKDTPYDSTAVSLTPTQLRYISIATGHELPRITLDDILRSLLNQQHDFDAWQKCLADIEDERLYHFVLNVDINALIDAASFDPTNLDKNILDAANKAMNRLLGGSFTIPSVISEEAYIFCLFETYKRLRSRGDNYTSTSSMLVASLPFFGAGLHKSEKLDACDIYMKFIVSNRKYNQFDDFLKERDIFDKKSTILQGKIKVIHDCVKKLGNELDDEEEFSAKRVTQSK